MKSTTQTSENQSIFLPRRQRIGAQSIRLIRCKTGNDRLSGNKFIFWRTTNLFEINTSQKIIRRLLTGQRKLSGKASKDVPGCIPAKLSPCINCYYLEHSIKTSTYFAWFIDIITHRTTEFSFIFTYKPEGT